MPDQVRGMMEKLKDSGPTAWGGLPDIQLYMDQLVSYMSRQLPDPDRGDKLTSAMVNNYIKAGLLPRAAEKRYSREHIALLTEICILKNIMTAKEMRPLMEELSSPGAVEAFYEKMCGSVEREMTAALGHISAESGHESLVAAALELAVAAYARQFACRKLVELIESRKAGGPADGHDGASK